MKYGFDIYMCYPNLKTLTCSKKITCKSAFIISFLETCNSEFLQTPQTLGSQIQTFYNFFLYICTGYEINICQYPNKNINLFYCYPCGIVKKKQILLPINLGINP